MKIRNMVGAKQKNHQHSSDTWLGDICPVIKALCAPKVRHESKEAELLPALHLPSPCFMPVLKSRILSLLSGFSKKSGVMGMYFKL